MASVLPLMAFMLFVVPIITMAEVGSKPDILTYWPIEKKANNQECLDISGSYAYYGNDAPESLAKVPKFPSLPVTIAHVLGYDASPTVEREIVSVRISKESQEEEQIHVDFFSSTGVVNLKKFVWGKTEVSCDSQRIIVKRNGEAKGEGVSGTVAKVIALYRATDGSLLAQLVVEMHYRGLESLYMPTTKEEYWARFAPVP